MASDALSAAETLPITAPPAPNQLIAHDSSVFTTIREGRAYILIPPTTKLSQNPRSTKEESAATAQNVFYNPIQQYNRDLTVLAIRAFGEDYVSRNESRWRKQQQLFREKRLRRQKRREETGERAVKRRRVGEAEGAEDEFDDGGLDVEDFLAVEHGGDEGNLPLLRSDSAPKEDTSGAEPGEIVNQAKENPYDDAPNPQRGGRFPFRILDALSATGLRALRYAHEIPFATDIVANDLSPDAVKSIKANVLHNAPLLPQHKKDIITVTTGNATAQMYALTGQEARGGPGPKFTVIDLDPYGTAIPFIDSAVQALADGGLLCVTCTDTAIFNSLGYLEKTYSLYGGLPYKGDACHEAGLRLILSSIATAAGKYGIAMEPLLSLSIDYYARVFVRLRKSPADVKHLAGKTMVVYNCDAGCGAWSTQPFARNVAQESRKGKTIFKHTAAAGPQTGGEGGKCEFCGFKTHVAGPMWGGPLHNKRFIERVLDVLERTGLENDEEIYGTRDRIRGMLSTAMEELEVFPEATPPLDQNNGSKEAEDSSKTSTTERSPTELVPAVLPNLLDPHPFYVVPSSLARVLRTMSPSDAQIRGALQHAGYRAVRTHAKPGCVKTDAPWSFIWELMRAWERENPIREGALNERMAGWRILHGLDRARYQGAVEGGGEWEEVQEGTDEMKVVRTEDGKWKVLRRKGDGAAANGSGVKKEEGSVDAESNGSAERKAREIRFDVKPKKDKRGLLRYQLNPAENWGPMARAKNKNK